MTWIIKETDYSKSRVMYTGIFIGVIKYCRKLIYTCIKQSF